MAVSYLVLAEVESAMVALVTIVVVLVLPSATATTVGFVVVGSITTCDVTDVNNRNLSEGRKTTITVTGYQQFLHKPYDSMKCYHKNCFIIHTIYILSLTYQEGTKNITNL